MIIEANLISLNARQWRITGSLDFQTVSSIYLAGIKLLKNTSVTSKFNSPYIIKINLADITTSNSAGVVLLYEWLIFAADLNIKLVYHQAPECILHLAALTKIKDLMPFALDPF